MNTWHINQSRTPRSHGMNAQIRDMQATLKRLGANFYDRRLPETHSLPHLLMDNEVVEGVVFGRYRFTNNTSRGRGALVATNRRVLFIDHKPLFLRTTEVTYDVVSGIARSSTGLFGAVTLSTRLGDVTVSTNNQRSTATFVHAIEAHIFQRRDLLGNAPAPHAF